MCLSIVAGASIGFPQEKACDSQDIAVSVREKRGNFISGIRASDFHAKVNGKDVQVRSANVFAGPLRVVLAIDTSGSMAGARRDLLPVMDEILSTFPAETQFALVVFSDRVLQTLEFGHSRDEILGSVYRTREFKEHTAVRDSLLQATTIFGSRQPGDLVIAVSDGGDNASKTSFAKLRDIFLSRRIRLFTLFLGKQYFQTAEERGGASDLQSISSLTGGSIRSIEAPDQIPTLRSLGEELGHFYVLGIELPTLDKRTRWEMEVVDSSGHKRKNVELAYPRALDTNCDGRQ